MQFPDTASDEAEEQLVSPNAGQINATAQNEIDNIPPASEEQNIQHPPNEQDPLEHKKSSSGPEEKDITD